MTRRLSASLLAGAAAAAALLAAASSPRPATAAFTPPPIRHVFVVELENKSYSESFGGTVAPYLARTLPSQGVLLSQYYGIGHLSLDDYVAQLSGQPPNPVTQSDCQLYADFNGGLPTVLNGGIAIGQGCVYPANVPTLADQLTAKGLSWKGYMEDMSSPCLHPALNAQDGTQAATATNQYAARHNPYIYFHSVIDNAASCAAHDVPLTALGTDLASVATTPAFSFITPNLCNDGHDAPCVGTDIAGRKDGGLISSDRWLSTYAPLITGSPAFRQDGMLIVTFDEAETLPSSLADASACCNEPVGPNTPNNGGDTPGMGGGRIGAVILSPFIAPGTATATPYNHYSLLRSLEDLFGITTGGSDGAGRLADAGAAGLAPFGPDVYTRAAGGTVVSLPPPSFAPITSTGGGGATPTPGGGTAPSAGAGAAAAQGTVGTPNTGGLGTAAGGAGAACAAATGLALLGGARRRRSGRG